MKNRIPTESEIASFLDLYKKFGSLRKVANATNRSINTVKKYLVGKVEFNQQDKVFNANIENEILIGTYVGLWMGDGTQYHDPYDGSYTVKICSNKKRIYLNRFIENIIFRIYGKKSIILTSPQNNSAYIKLRSKFIYDFVYNYVSQDEGRKTYTVQLKKNIRYYSLDFLSGCLLGLMLSDGYMKKRSKYTSVSYKLAKNAFDIMIKFGFKPTHSLDKREHKAIAHDISLSVNQTKKLKIFLSGVIGKMGYDCSATKLKYGSTEI